MSLIFDLNDKFSFDNFEVFNMNMNKNSPSVPVLRGKGSLHSAENFVFSDTFQLTFILKEYEMERIYGVYALYRSKGIVFLDSIALFNKLFPSVEQKRNDSVRAMVQKEIIELRKKTDTKLMDKLKYRANLLVQHNIVRNFEELKELFKSETYIDQDFYETSFKTQDPTAFDLSVPFLTMLKSFDVKSIASSSDGFQVTLTLYALDELMDADTIERYKTANAEYDNYFDIIQDKVSELLYNKDLTLNMSSLENEVTIIRSYTDTTNQSPQIQKTILEENLHFPPTDISEFEIITYNNIAEVPIQGRSRPLKQFLGVGESSMTVRLFYKNDEWNDKESILLQKIKRFKYLAEQEQRNLKIDCQFGYLNALDLNGVEISDIYLSNDPTSDGFMISILFKTSGYFNRSTNEINVYGEKVNETPYHKTKDSLPDEHLFSKYSYYLTNSVCNTSSSNYDKIVQSQDNSDSFTYMTLLKSYFTNDLIPISQLTADTSPNSVRGATINSNYKTVHMHDTKTPLKDMKYLSEITYIISEILSLIVKEVENKGFMDGYVSNKSALRTIIKKAMSITTINVYDFSVEMLNSFLPTDIVNSKILTTNECLKFLFLQSFANLDTLIFEIITAKEETTNSELLQYCFNNSKDLNKEKHQVKILKTATKAAFNRLLTIVKSNGFLSSYQQLVTNYNESLKVDNVIEQVDTFKESYTSVVKTVNSVKSLIANQTVFSETGASSTALSTLMYKMRTIKNIRRDIFDYNSESYTDEDHLRLVKNKKTELNYTEPILMGILSVLSYDYGISTSSYGGIAMKFFATFIDAGIQANNLFLSLPKDSTYIGNGKNLTTLEEVLTNVRDPLMSKIYGPNFVSETSGYYRPLASNVELTDLGSYLGISSADFQKDNKVLYIELLESLDFKNVNKYKESEKYIDVWDNIKNLYTKTLKDSSISSSDDIKETNKDVMLGTKQDDDKAKKLDDVVDSALKENSVLFEQFSNINNSLNINITSEDAKKARYDAFNKGGEYLTAFLDLFSNDLNSMVPTYDIYVIRESAFIDINSYAETLKIEDFLGLDKMVSMSIQYTERFRGKTAMFSFIDTTEERIRNYGKIPPSYQIRNDLGANANQNDLINEAVSKTKQVLRVGDRVSIRMGYNNKNKVIFNGNVSSISEGKVKDIVCVSHVADLENDTFDFKISDSIMEWRHHILGNEKDRNKQSIESAYKSRVNSYVNNHIILDNVNTLYAAAPVQNFSEAFRKEEECSTFNMINYALCLTQSSLNHFKNQNYLTQTNLATALRESASFASSFKTHVGEIFLHNKGLNSNGVDEILIANINNVDRDSIYYGFKSYVDGSDEVISGNHPFSAFTIDNTSFYIKGSSYVDPIIRDQQASQGFAFYKRNDATLKDVLLDAERRSPGTYFNVLESGFGSSLFYGRGYYNLDLIDVELNQQGFSSVKAGQFLLQLQQRDITNVARYTTASGFDSFEFFKSFSEALASINSKYSLIAHKKNEEISTNSEDSSDFDVKFNLPKASNIVYAVTDRNLISNGIIVTDNSFNKLTINYSRSLTETVEDMLNFKNKVSIYASNNFVNDVFENRVKEKYENDSMIRNEYQATELAQSLLQNSMEQYYNGKLVILFNPNIRYRTEIKIFDSINQMYGSVMVKDFEHKFDYRGAYTVITPMMKIEPTQLLNDMAKRGFWSRVLYSKEKTQTEFAEELTYTSIFYKNGSKSGPTLPFSKLGEYFKKDLESVPIVVGDSMVRNINNNKNPLGVLKLDNVDSSYRALPLSVYPVASKSTYLLPDLDIYQSAQKDSEDTLLGSLYNLQTTLGQKLTYSSNIRSSFEENIWQHISRGTYNKFRRLLTPSDSTVSTENKMSFLGNLDHSSNALDRYGNVKQIVQDSDITDSQGYNGHTLRYVDGPTVGFWNVKVLQSREDDRIKRVAKVISNFDVCGLVELSSGVEDSTGKMSNGGRAAAESVCKKLIDELNNIQSYQNAKSHTWKYVNLTLMREKAQAMISSKSTDGKAHGFADEYTVTIYRQANNKANRTFELEELAHESITFNVGYQESDDSTDAVIKALNDPASTATINYQGVRITTGRHTNDFYFFHNIFGAHSSLTKYNYYVTPMTRVNALLEVLKKHNRIRTVFNRINDVTVMGDFNMSLYDGRANKITPSLGRRCAFYPVYNSDYTNASRDSFYTQLKPLILPSDRTTLGYASPSNSYDNAISTRWSFHARVYREIMDGNFATTRKTVSDHFPIYIRF